MLILLCLLLFYGLRFIGRVLWRTSYSTLHVLMAYAFMGLAVFHGLGMSYDPARAYRHCGMTAICYAFAIGHCWIVASLPIDHHHLPKAQVIP